MYCFLWEGVAKMSSACDENKIIRSVSTTETQNTIKSIDAKEKKTAGKSLTHTIFDEDEIFYLELRLSDRLSMSATTS